MSRKAGQKKLKRHDKYLSDMAKNSSSYVCININSLSHFSELKLVTAVTGTASDFHFIVTKGTK